MEDGMPRVEERITQVAEMGQAVAEDDPFQIGAGCPHLLIPTGPLHQQDDSLLASLQVLCLYVVHLHQLPSGFPCHNPGDG